MSGKGLISRMSDECLMKGKSGLLYFGEYQAGMRKFTLARKTLRSALPLRSSKNYRLSARPLVACLSMISAPLPAAVMSGL